MAWIESHQELGQHPKTRRLAHLLGVSKPAAVGHLQYLWWWAMDYADDGNLARFDALDIAIGSEWDGDEGAFVDALVGAGFIDRDPDGSHHIHDWDQYGGKLAARRKANAERMRKARADHDSGTEKERAAHVQRTQRARVEREKSRGEKKREEKKTDDPTGASAGGVHPFSVLEAFVETIGQDTSEITERQKGKQLAVAKRLLADGVTVEDVIAFTRYLLTQTWRSSAFDLFTVEKEIGAWQMSGKPERATPGGSLSIVSTDPNINPATGKPYPYNHPKNPRSMVG